MAKLYPPNISETLPAFYSKEGQGMTRAIIVVPFSMNKAVSQNLISGFKLKIKAAQSGNLIKELTLLFENIDEDKKEDLFEKKEIPFVWTNRDIVVDDRDLNNLKIGQFYKVQMAYIDTNGEVGYYSTVGIIKYTSKPIVKIKYRSWDSENNKYINQDLVLDESSNVNNCTKELVGVYDNSDGDITEVPYSYRFSLYGTDGELKETSDWLFFGDKSFEEVFYSIKTKVVLKTDYLDVQYEVKTINNLIVKSPLYRIAMTKTFPMDGDLNTPTISDIIIENNFEESYVFISLKINNNNTQDLFLELLRSSEKDFEEFESIQTTLIPKEKITQYAFKDLSIQQGIKYKYACRYYDRNNIYLSENEDDKKILNILLTGEGAFIKADFEDAFLCDEKRQLKIRFNPKISSFKTIQLESKFDTIGSKYPFIFKNGIVNYKEFPISGLISYHLDENKMFFNDEELGIIFNNELEILDNNLEYIETLNLTDYNIKIERLFKLKVLDWLNNGKPKLFKSPSEGNYIVSLMNISLSPEDRLSRMIHSFSCTAYEIKDINYDSLTELKLVRCDTDE